MNTFKKLFLSLSIYKKLAIGVFIFISFIFISTAFIALNIADKQTSKIVEELIDSNINSNHDFLTDTILAGDSWTLFKFLKTLTQNSVIKTAGIVDNDNIIIAHSSPKENKTGEYFKENQDLKVIEIYTNGIKLGQIILEVEQRSLNNMIKEIFIENGLFLLLVVFLSVVIAIAVIRNILNRFKIVIANMDALSQKKWDNIQNDSSLFTDEISSLINQSINLTKDIKNYMQKEENLRVFYRDILKSIDSLILICDKQINIKYHNNNVLSEIMLNEKKTFLLDTFYQTIQSNMSYKKSFIIELEDDDIKYLLVNIQYLDENIIIRFSDITKIKEIEENEKIVHSLQLLGEISSQFAHEIKNLIQPLTLLLPKNASPDKEDLSMIHNTINKMKEQVSDFLLLGKPLTIDPQSNENVIDILNEVISLFSVQINNKQLMIKCDLPKELYINMNKKDIEIMLINLVKNAIEASLENETIKISWIQTENNNVFRISNKGNTIKDTKKIFKPFYTTKQEGSGLGLFTIYKMIHLIKGKIDVKSENNLSTFTISIPNRITL